MQLNRACLAAAAAVIVMVPQALLAQACNNEITRRSGLCVQQTGIMNGATCLKKATDECRCNEATAQCEGAVQETGIRPAPSPGPASKVPNPATAGLLMPPAGLLANDPAREVELSRALIQFFLNHACQSNAKLALPLGDRIQSALKDVTDLRDVPGYSVNIALRDGEYYLHGLYAAVSGDTSHLAITYGASFYEKLKKLAWDYPTLTRMMQTTNNPMSPPGGSAWAYAGLQDGKGIANTPTTGTSGCGLHLKALSP